MPYCPNCGQQIDANMKFCPSCGQALAATGTATVNTVVPVTSVTPVATVEPTDYHVVLVDRGSCTKAEARELIADMLGYTKTSVGNMLDILPVEIAVNLTAAQAAVVCQVLSEYEMTAACYNSAGYVDLSPYARSSIFGTNGAMLSETANILATLGEMHRVHVFTRSMMRDPLRYAFRPAYKRYPRRAYQPAHLGFGMGMPRPPKTIIRSRVTPRPPMRPAPAPAPAQRPAPAPRPAKAPMASPAPRSAARPAPAQRTSPMGGSRGPASGRGQGGGRRGPGGGRP